MAVLGYYKNSYVRALVKLFPEIGLRKNKFPAVSSNCQLLYSITNASAGEYWVKPANRKRFFDSFAQRYDFDPLLPHNWYLIPSENIREQKVYIVVLFIFLTHYCSFRGFIW